MLGLSVIYTLTAADAEQINRRRTSRRGISERIAYGTWPLGAQAHIGNAAGAGQKFPGIVVRDWGRCQNLQVRIQKWIDLLRAAYRIDETGFSTALAYIGAVLSEEGN